MIFYSRENGRDGEKDYIDTEDFKDVYFEKEEFSYLKNGSNNRSGIEFSLEFEPSTTEVSLKGTLRDGNYAISESVVIDPVQVVEQGAVAYYQEELLDNIKVISNAKNIILNKIKTRLLEDNCLLKGTNLDVIGFIVNNHNTIAVFDNVTIVDEKTLVTKMFYSITNINTIMSGKASVLLSDNKKLIGDIDSITERDGGLTIKLSTYKIEETDEKVEYKKSSEFSDIEDYYENRANFINIDTTSEADFDEFDDLF